MQQAQQEIDAMWIPDLRLQAWSIMGAVIATTSALPVEAGDGYAMGRCVIVRASQGGGVYPTIGADSYISKYHGEEPRYRESISKGWSFSGGKVSLLKAPKHGKLTIDSNDSLATNEYWYTYIPKEGYQGKDRFVMQVEKDGVIVKIFYVIQVIGNEEPDPGYCNPPEWKISAVTGSGFELDQALDTLSQNGLLANAAKSFAGFSDLKGGTIGQTTGTGSNTTITLDTNAAGHGCYIDYTPYLNEEFLATSNPNEWVAKEGTDAYGKMDLLSVLLHEYGPRRHRL